MDSKLVQCTIGVPESVSSSPKSRIPDTGSCFSTESFMELQARGTVFCKLGCVVLFVPHHIKQFPYHFFCCNTVTVQRNSKFSDLLCKTAVSRA